MDALGTLTRRWPGLALAACATVLTVGCDSQTSEPTTDIDTPSTEDIDARFGGYEPTDESPGFGMDYLLDEGEQAFADGMAQHPEVVQLLGRDDVTAYAVRVTWGYLTRDSSHTNLAVDWSGSAVVDTGAIVGRRTILFERRQGDEVVRPRPNRRVLEWISTTTVHLDGIQLVVLDPTGEDGDGTFTIDMPLFTETFALSDLADLDVLSEVDDAGHQVHVQARKLVRPDDPAYCRNGWLAGRWVDADITPASPHGVLGHFEGHWTNAEGTIAGSLRGIYGVNRRGHRVLFGKLVTDDGTFEALMRGRWSPSESSAGWGAFHARLYSREREVLGGVRGVWERRREGEGAFTGGWALLCSDEGDVELDETIFETED